MSLNEKLADIVHEIEEGKRPLAWENLSELGALARSLGRTGPEPIAIPASHP
jgi:hypothetical protein